MTYLFKRKFSISELANVHFPVKKVLIAEPEEYLKQLYSLHLMGDNFSVFHSEGINSLEAEIVRFSPHLLMISTEFTGRHSDIVASLKKIKNRFPSIYVVTMCLNTNGEHLKDFMKVGVSSHIERRLTRLTDAVAIVKSILN